MVVIITSGLGDILAKPCPIPSNKPCVNVPPVVVGTVEV
jgi:hypothetical protein